MALLLRSSETQPLFIDLSSIDRNQHSVNHRRASAPGAAAAASRGCICQRGPRACCRACVPVTKPVASQTLRSGASEKFPLHLLQGLLLQKGANPPTPHCAIEMSLFPGQTDRKALALLGAAAHRGSRSACGRLYITSSDCSRGCHCCCCRHALLRCKGAPRLPLCLLPGQRAGQVCRQLCAHGPRYYCRCICSRGCWCSGARCCLQSAARLLPGLLPVHDWVGPSALGLLCMTAAAEDIDFKVCGR